MSQVRNKKKKKKKKKKKTNELQQDMRKFCYIFSWYLSKICDLGLSLIENRPFLSAKLWVGRGLYTQTPRLDDAILMIPHNIQFHNKIRKIP